MVLLKKKYHWEGRNIFEQARNVAVKLVKNGEKGDKITHGKREKYMVPNYLPQILSQDEDKIHFSLFPLSADRLSLSLSLSRIQQWRLLSRSNFSVSTLPKPIGHRNRKRSPEALSARLVSGPLTANRRRRGIPPLRCEVRRENPNRTSRRRRSWTRVPEMNRLLNRLCLTWFQFASVVWGSLSLWLSSLWGFVLPRRIWGFWLLLLWKFG